VPWLVDQAHDEEGREGQGLINPQAGGSPMEDEVLPPENGSNTVQKHDQWDHKGPDRISKLHEFSIQEIDPTLDGTMFEVEEGGTVDLNKFLDVLENLEKVRVRRNITYCLLLLQIAWTFAGLLCFFLTGNTLLLITALPTSLPVGIIIGHYFVQR
jgi:hypothetical protein